MRFDLACQFVFSLAVVERRQQTEQKLSEAGHYSSLKVTAGLTRVAYRAGT
jgi:hypothetical protein